jgi:WD40 repeat protein
MSLIAGSYEKFLWGFKLKPQNTDPNSQTLTLIPLFSYPSHLSAITSVATAGSAAASGGSDDTIQLYDLSHTTSVGSLSDHSATVTSLSFFTPPNLSFPLNLVSADADGSFCIYEADPFVLLKSLKPHRKAINDLSLHPSGKLALTVGKDECLAMINLVRGRRSFYCSLGKEASLVNFDGSGDKFYLATEEKVTVHEAEDARLLCELENPKRVLCAEPGEVSVLAIWLRFSV